MHISSVLSSSLVLLTASTFTCRCKLDLVGATAASASVATGSRVGLKAQACRPGPPWHAFPAPVSGRRAKKEVNKEIKTAFLILYINVWVRKRRAFPRGPGGFRKLREAYRNPSEGLWP